MVLLSVERDESQIILNNWRMSKILLANLSVDKRGKLSMKEVLDELASPF